MPRSASRISAEPALDAGDRIQVGCPFARAVDAPRQCLDLSTQQLYRLARQGFGELKPDFCKVAAEAGDNFVKLG